MRKTVGTGLNEPPYGKRLGPITAVDMPGSNRLLTGGAFLLVAFIALWANSAYLWAFATPSLFYFANVAAHPALGVLVAVVAARWFLRTGTRTAMGWVVGLAGLATVTSGLIVVTNGAFGANRALLVWHIWISAATVALVVAGMARLLWATRWTPGTRAVFAALAVLIAATAGAVRSAAIHE